MPRKDHWDAVYTAKTNDEVSWFEIDPTISLDLIQQVSPPPSSVIDVGGGQSFLVDRLLDIGNGKVAVLDISSVALERTKERLGEQAASVDWIEADITSIPDVGRFDLWHVCGAEMSVEIRPETEQDRAAIRLVNQAAFGGNAEANLVDALRDGGFVEVSLVAVDNEQIVGHILFSRVQIAARDETVDAMSLAPMFMPNEKGRTVSVALRISPCGAPFSASYWPSSPFFPLSAGFCRSSSSEAPSTPVLRKYINVLFDVLIRIPHSSTSSIRQLVSLASPSGKSCTGSPVARPSVTKCQRVGFGSAQCFFVGCGLVLGSFETIK